MEQAEVTFDDVAVYFTEEEWRSLQEDQKNLYKEVMSDNYQMILSLNRPDIITNIQLGCEPYVTTAKAVTIRDSRQVERLAASVRSALQKRIHTASGSHLSLKRQRRYPRVNPFRWIRRYKKCKNLSIRAPRRLETREKVPDVESNETSSGRKDVCPGQPGEAANCRETFAAMDTDCSSNFTQTNEGSANVSPSDRRANVSPSDGKANVSPIDRRGNMSASDRRGSVSPSDRRAAESSPHMMEEGRRIIKSGHNLLTNYRMHTKNKPDLRVTLFISEKEPRGPGGFREVPADLGRDILHIAEEARSSSDVPPPPEKQSAENIDDLGHTQSCTEAQGPSQSASETNNPLMDTDRSQNPNREQPREKSLMNSVCEVVATPRRREKHVTFSDFVTTFIIGQDDERGSEDGGLQKNKRHQGLISFIKSANSTDEHAIRKSSIPNAEPIATTIHDRTGNQDLSSQKSAVTMKEAEGCPPNANTGGNIEPQLQQNHVDEEYMVTKNQGSKPNDDPKTTTIHDRGGNQDLSIQKLAGTMKEVEGCPASANIGGNIEPQLQQNHVDEEHVVTKSPGSKSNGELKTTTIRERGGIQDLSSQKSAVGTKAEGCPPSESAGDDVEPQLQPHSIVEEDMSMESQGAEPSATEIETTLCDMLRGEKQSSQTFMSCNNTMKEVKVSPERDTAQPSQSNGPQLQPRQKDAATQINPFHKEEDHQPVRETQRTPPHPANADQNFIKSYYCSNCGKITHWTRLNDQQKADVENSFQHICARCSRQKDKNNVEASPRKGSSTPNASPTNGTTSSKAIVIGSPARKKSRPLLASSPDASPTDKKQVPERSPPRKKSRPLPASSPDASPTDKKQVPERSPPRKKSRPLPAPDASPTANKKQKHEVNKAESAKTSAIPNIEVKKAEVASPRSSTSPNTPLKKGEEAIPMLVKPSPFVQLKKLIEASSRSSASPNVQLKKLAEASSRSSTSPNVHLKKLAEASFMSSTSPDVQLKNLAEASSRSSTSPNIQLKKVEQTSPRNSTSPNIQLKKGEELSTRISASPNSQLKKVVGASPRSSTIPNVELKKVVEGSPRSSTSPNIQLKKGQESLRLGLTSPVVQLKKLAEASPRSLTSLIVQQKKGEEPSPRSSTTPNVELKKVNEASPRLSSGPKVQLKKVVEGSPRSSTSPNIQLKKGEEALPMGLTSPVVQLKKLAEISPRSLTSLIAQQKGGELSPRSSAIPNIQLKKGEEPSPRISTSPNIQLKKVLEASPRSSTSPKVQLKKSEESQRTLANHKVHLPEGGESIGTSSNINVQLQNNDEEFSRPLSNFEVQLKKRPYNKKKRLAAEDSDDQSNLCSDCGHFEGSEDAKLHQRVKATDGTPKKSPSHVFSHPGLKTYASPKNKSNKIVQNEKSSAQEEKHASDSRSSHETVDPQDERDGAPKRNMKHVCTKCTKCGKLFQKGKKTKPLGNIQEKKPAWGGSPPISAEKVRTTKSNAVRKERLKKSPGEPKERKLRKAKGPKGPRTPREPRDMSLCTKCGKRLALHVVPSQDGTSEGGNDENECVVLPRKKRKRPLAGMEPFTCNECGKIFTRHFTLVQHRLIHTGERPHSCKVCMKTFRDSSYLIVHMRSHTKEKPYTCPQCGKCFSQNSALHVHLRTHTDERPFQCKECGKTFTDRSTYRHHLRIHTGEKPYACSYCGKTFTQQPHMKRHETIHTGMRPFGCNQCGKRFIERTKLKKHQLVHQKKD